MNRTPRQTVGALIGGIVLIGGLVACADPTVSSPAPSANREETASQVLAGISVVASVSDDSLAATSVSADFGLDEGVRLVQVRIIETLAIAIRIESEHHLVLAEDPVLCLVGPFSNPIDAGLSDRCWGEPDLQQELVAQLSTDDAGHPVLEAGEVIELEILLRRGDVRCDYPPGEWQLEIAAAPLIDGVPTVRTGIADITVQVPFETGTLELLPLDQTRFCSYADAIYNRQGDPPVSTP